MILLYYVLLAVWPLPLWPAWRLKGCSSGGGGMSYSRIEPGRKVERLTQVFYAGQTLLFEAKFRSSEAYASNTNDP